MQRDPALIDEWLMRTEGKVGIIVSGSLGNSSAVIALVAIPGPVIWSYLVGGAVLAIGLVTIFLRGDWQKARGFDKLLLFGPLFCAGPIAAFGTEHFTVTETIASLMPAWIPLALKGSRLTKIPI
jgi:hypothetical protein